MTLQELIEQLALIDSPDLQEKIHRMTNMIKCWAEVKRRENNIQQASEDVITAYLMAHQLNAQRGSGLMN